MTDEAPEILLAEVGRRISQLGYSGSHRFFLYLETEEGMQSPYLMQEFDDEVQAIPPAGVTSLLYDSWLNAKPQRWSAMWFELDGDKFSATFDYDIDPTDGLSDQRAQAVIDARFGDKPVVYPSDDAWFEQQMRQSKMFD